MNTVKIEARDLPDAWFQSLREVYDKGYEYTIDRGSFEGQRRKELDFVEIDIQYPGVRPLIPDVPPGLGISPPTDMDFVRRYMRYWITMDKEPNEQYTYGESIAPQIEEVIRIYKEDGFMTNQACITVGSDRSIYLPDPPCLRVIDTRIRDNKLHFYVYFRSWDLWGGFPANLAALQLLKEYIVAEIGNIEDGEIIALSKGLHLYDHAWEVAGMRLHIKGDGI